MTRDDDNYPEDEDLNEFAIDPFNRRTDEQQNVEGYNDGFEDDFDEAYDEPERDTPYSPAYQEEEEDYGEMAAGQLVAAPVGDNGNEDHDLFDTGEGHGPEENGGPAGEQWSVQQLAAAGSEPWTDSQDYLDDEGEPDPDFIQRWPMGLLLVAVIAVVLLIAGGYGVMQQRAESNEEIRQLRAALATAASDEDLEKVRAEAAALRTENSDLQDMVYDLQMENRKLSDLVTGLEAQVDAANKAAEKARQPRPVPAAPAAETLAVEKKPVPAAGTPAAGVPATGSWFVNFGSYGKQAMAESWRDKLDPASGEVITASSERDGRTLYRVRIVNLPDKETANAVARALEQKYGLPRLWVGQQ